MLVLDEVYYPFGDVTGIELIKEFDNVFIMRSFSKAFGLAGIRLGYLIGNNENIDYVSDIWSDWYDNDNNGIIDDISETDEWAYNMEFKDIIITKIKNQEYINGKYNVWYDPSLTDNVVGVDAIDCSI